MKDRILTLFSVQNEWSVKELQKEMHLKDGREFTRFIKTLNALEEDRILYNNHAKYYLIDNINYMVGIAKDISHHEYAVSNSERKVYVKKKYATNVFDRDEVLVKCGFNAKILHIYKHDIRYIIGTFIHTKKGWIFHSDINFHRQFDVKNIHQFKLKSGMKAVVEINKYADPLVVSILKIIGFEKEPGVDITSILYANNVRMNFGDKVLQDIIKLPNQVNKQDKKGRIDYRNLLTVTIDGDDAKDFDDAISIEKTKSGYTLYVHIADVSHYVKESSSIDQEAYARATSVYVTDRVIPMLPFELSNGICSLNPDVDRCTLTCKMSINTTGKVTSYEIVPSLIHSDRRCTYHKVNAVLNGDPVAIDEYKEILNLIYHLSDLAHLLQKRSKNRGCIDFQTTESNIILDENGKAIKILKKSRGFAEQMIEESMILANVCVANYLHSKQLPCMYRVHEQPDPEKVQTIGAIASALQVPFDFNFEDVTTKELQQFLDSIHDPQLFEIFSMITLRAMQKAKYDAHCIGHFGLALEEYCHFTSPIRRYSDLVVHRMLRKYVFDKEDEKAVTRDIKKIERQSFHVSQKERDAIQVERLVSDYKKAEYMESKIGHTFVGHIVGVQSFGFFVELNNSIEGLVPLHSLYEYYEYDEDTMSLHSTSNVLHLGQKVRVTCSDVNRAKGQVEFVLSQ